MKVQDALQCLGATRVIWIDDYFNDTPALLAKLLTDNIEITQSCGFPELAERLESYEIDPDEVSLEVVQILTDASKDRLKEIKRLFFEREREVKQFAGKELSADAVDRVCELLSIEPDDRWTFERASKEIAALPPESDESVSYVVDLNDARGPATRGLDILRELWARGSKGTAFILTHEATTTSEGDWETRLRGELTEGGDTSKAGIPVCVIAKERLYEDPDAGQGIEEALRIAIKRAGLRRSVHEVLWQARGELMNAFNEAESKLLSIVPEQLDTYVVERGYREGVSELHVVERALTAHISQQLRSLFGKNDVLVRGVGRVRSLRNIQLKPGNTAPDENLLAFRKAEVWESDELINGAYTPIACGDVFEMDKSEKATKGSNKKFLLLGQPCDISLRPGEKRQQDTAFLVPLKIKAEGPAKASPKEPLLPFQLDGQQWACDFRNVTMVKLSILDLASFRRDGIVRVDHGHAAADALLAGQRDVYVQRTACATKVLDASVGNGSPSDSPQAKDGTVRHDPELQLTFSNVDSFRHIHYGTFEPASKVRVSGVTTETPARVTWRLRRSGRIRMPYAAAMLEQYMDVMSRQAFDLDYMAVGMSVAEPETSGHLKCHSTSAS